MEATRGSVHPGRGPWGEYVDSFLLSVKKATT